MRVSFCLFFFRSLPLLAADFLFHTVAVFRAAFRGKEGKKETEALEKRDSSKLTGSYPSSRLHPLHPSGRHPPAQLKRGPRRKVGVARGAESPIPGQDAEVHALVQADLRDYALRVVGGFG